MTQMGRVVDWFETRIKEEIGKTVDGSPRGLSGAVVMELEELRDEVKRLERGLVLACRDVARLKLIANRDETGEDFSEEHVRLCGADELREVMLRVAKGECPR